MIWNSHVFGQIIYLYHSLSVFKIVWLMTLIALLTHAAHLKTKNEFFTFKEKSLILNTNECFLSNIDSSHCKENVEDDKLSNTDSDPYIS